MTARADIVAALPDYDIGEELGRGGFGVVLAARHRQLRRDVAIKELPTALAADPRVRARFASEARVLAALSHPHIVPIYDYVERDGLCLLVMEKLTGGTLWEQFKTHGLTAETTCAVTMAACAALQYAHQRGILHRDVKPENLLYSADAVLKITDFGIAKVVGGGETLATRGGEILGTPAYMAPEQAEGKELGPQADVYALGVMMYELLSGHLPFSEDGGALAIVYRHVYEQPIPLSDVAPSVEPALAAVNMRAIARQPGDRFQTAEAFGVAIGEAVTPNWGADWLSRAGLQIVDSGPISESAKRPSGSSSAGFAPSGLVTPSPTGPGGAPVSGGDLPYPAGPPSVGPAPAGSGSPTVGPAPVGGAPLTVGPAPRSRDSVGPPPIVGPPGGALPTIGPGQSRPPGTVGVPAAARAPRPGGPVTVVRPQVVDHVVGGMGNEIYGGGAELVPVRQVIELPSPPYAVGAAALVLFIVTITFGLVGLGKTKTATTNGLSPGVATVAGTDPTATATVKLDLSKPITVMLNHVPAGVTQAQLGFSVFGVPLPASSVQPLTQAGSSSTAALSATTDKFLTGGQVTGDLKLLDASGAVVKEQKFLAKNTGSAFLTVPGGLLIALFLFFVAYLESLFRPLRRGRRGVSGVAGMGILGLGLGADIAGLLWLLGSPEPTITTFVVCALCGAGAAACGSLAGIRMARRARIKPRRR